MLTITLEDLQSRFLRILANQCFVRYWVYWDGTDSTRMALRCQDWQGKHIQVQDLLDAGFVIETRDGLEYYVCQRAQKTVCVCDDPAEVLFSGLSGVLRSTNGVIERCDACGRFESDEKAQEAYAAHETFVSDLVNQNITVAEQHLLVAAGLRIVGVTVTEGYISQYKVKSHGPDLAAQQVSYQELMALAQSRLA